MKRVLSFYPDVLFSVAKGLTKKKTLFESQSLLRNLQLCCDPRLSVGSIDAQLPDTIRETSVSR